MNDWLYTPGEAHQARLASAIYTPLPLDASKGEVRLLKVNFSARTREDISCTLQVRSLSNYEQLQRNADSFVLERRDSDRSSLPSKQAAHATRQGAPAYTALSYTWGSTTQNTKTVRVNGRPGLRITSNLYAALRRLRQQSSGTYFWIDSVCINQYDMRERSWQVKMMGRIFHLAEKVIVWLGESEVMQTPPISSDHRLWRANSFLYDAPEQPQHTMSQEEALGNAIVLQEFIMARNDPIVQFGSYTIPWQSFMLMFRNAKELQNTFSSFWNARRTVKTDKGSIFSFRDLAGSTNATDARDKVYCFLSLIRQEEADVIEPDYTDPCHVVYAKTTHALFLAHGNLHVLAYVLSRPERSEDLPSWSVDFAFDGLQVFSIGDGATYAAVVEVLQAWKCCISPTPTLSISGDAMTLKMRGCQLDEVRDVVPLSDDPSKWDGRNHSLGPELRKALAALPEQNPYHCLPSDSSRRTSMHGPANVDWTPLITEAEQMTYNYTWNLTDILKILRMWKTACKLEQDHIDSGLEQRRLHDWAEYAYHIKGKVVLFTTSAGFLGVGPASIAAGDLVTLMHGSNAPVIVRKIRDHYRFKALALVNGIMDDELQNLNFHDSLAQNDFDLR